MNIKESVYFSSPIWVQNLLVSTYGYKLYKQRYGDSSIQYLSDLRKSEKLSELEMQKLQDNRFVELVRHAMATVPYYKTWSNNEKINPLDIKSLSELKYFPVITKDMIRNDPDMFVSDGINNLFKLNTSGTSGKPLTIYTDTVSRTHHYAFFTRLRSWFGITEHDWRATFFGRIICHPEQTLPPFWRYDYFQKNVIFSSYHLSDKNLNHYYKKLVSLNPAEIIGYPSSIFLLAKYMKHAGLQPLKPKVVFTTAEVLLPHQREIIEEKFKCPVIDQYGCTEMAFFASQCEYGSMHLHPEHGYMEVVGDDYSNIECGSAGIALCTGFINKAMPLIRYEVGDILSLSVEICKCGRSFPMIKLIGGRIDDILVSPDGRPLGRLDPVFKGIKGIYETQIVQIKTDVLQFNLVHSSEFSNASENKLLYEIRKRVGKDMVIKFNYVNEIKKNSNGKFKAVVKVF